MSLGLSADAQVAEDIASGAASPAQALVAAITVYRAWKAAKGAAGALGVATALDKAELLEPAIGAIVALAPVLQGEVSDPAKKARLFAFLGSL